MHNKRYINNLYNCIYLQLVYSTYICYYNLANKKGGRAYQERTATNQKRKVSRLYHNRRNGTRL